ncbi:MAG: terminase family protein, partial [Gemmatimonadaceae bacterium]|nr:terminase family protein [Gemmatimonadaceae bacterium]
MLNEAQRYNVLKMGRRWGKTILMLRLATETALQGHPAAYFAPSYPMLSDALRQLASRLVNVPRAKILLSEHRIELPTGGSIDMWSATDEANRCRGRKYARVLLDECALVDGLIPAWEESIRPTLTDLAGDAWFASTPRHGSQFEDLWEKGGVQDGWASWLLPTSTNPFISPAEIDEAARVMSPAAFKREYLAETDPSDSDLVYPEFSIAKHVKKPTVTWEECKWRVIGIDPGGGDPTAMVPIGVSPTGYFHQYGEFYKRGGVSIDEAVNWIEQWNKRGKLDMVVIDPSAKGWVETLQRYGYPSFPAFNGREDGFEVVRWLLNGRLTFDPTATNCIAEFRDYRWANKRNAASGERFATKSPADHHADGKDALR